MLILTSYQSVKYSHTTIQNSFCKSHSAMTTLLRRIAKSVQTIDVQTIGRYFLFLGLSIAILGIILDRESHTVRDIIDEFYANVGSELISIAITILLIDRLNNRRAEQDEKRRLILQLSSPHNEIATEAARVLGLKGWLSDGSLQDAVLDGADLHRVHLPPNANLRRVTLLDAILTNAKLRGVIFSDSNLDGIDLTKSDLGMAYLERVSLRHANLSSADLSGAFLNEANLSHTSLRNTQLVAAKMERTFFIEAQLEHANLSQASLPEADLQAANLRGAFLSKADLQRAKLKACDLRDAVLEDTVLKDALLTKALLTNAKLGRANLVGADLSGADLQRVNLVSANLMGARLDKTNFGYASLEISHANQAIFHQANLAAANLNGMCLYGANLTEANLEGAIIENIRCDTDTILPDGTPWTQVDDFMRFIDPQHSNFWRSDNPESPAYK